MSARGSPDTDWLLDQAATGNKGATNELLARHRARLHRMVAVRFDPRLASRLDPSDVVQETLVEALRKLPVYLRDRPIPFYPWLRQIAWNRLIDLHRRHVRAEQRAIGREVTLEPPLSGQSAVRLADLLLARDGSPSARLVRQELIHRMREAIAQLPATQREILLLRHVEDLSVAEVAAVLETTESAVKSRHFRALSRLRELLTPDS